jgi:TRAP-type C4-dicarboxylate transport system permease small subunit
VLRALDALMKAVRLACGLAFACFCALILVQVVNRYALWLAMFWTEELVLLLFVWSVMLGVPAALWWRDEIVVDIIQLPAAFDRSRLVMVDLLSMLFLIALSWSGLALMQRGGISTSPALGLPRSWFYASIPLGAVLGLMAIAGRMLRPATRPSDKSSHASVAHD